MGPGFFHRFTLGTGFTTVRACETLCRISMAAGVALALTVPGCGRGEIDLLEEETFPPNPQATELGPSEMRAEAGSSQTPAEAGSPAPFETTPPVASTPPFPTWTPPDGGPSCEQPCPLSAKYCNPRTLRCVPCLKDWDCGRGYVCSWDWEENTSRCVQCEDASHCPFPYVPVCENNQCRSCVSDDECPKGPGFKFSCYNGGCFIAPPPDDL